MKKVLIALCLPLYGSHITLPPAKKEEFVQKRLTMMKAQLAQKMRELLHMPTSSGKAKQLEKEIADLQKTIPITEQSLDALKGA